MCGILFSTFRENPKESFDLIKYRGPDNTTLGKFNNCWFGHHRLNIIEIANDKNIGNQPIVLKNDNKRYVLLCNGEIYNYNTFGYSGLKSDCEVITRLYNQYGINGLKQLDGDYAYVLFVMSSIDTCIHEIIIGRDPVGLKPLFYYHSGNDLVVSSEMKVIEDILKKANKTIEIKKVNINTIMRFNSNISSFTEEEISDIYNVETQNMTESFHNNNIYNILRESVRKRLLHTNKPVALLCSGGIDSSIICALVYDILKTEQNSPMIENMHVFTMIYENGISYDSMYANMLINDLKVKSTQVTFNKDAVKIIPDIINYLETYDPNTIRASIPMYLLAKYIKENTDYKVILSGEGADELFMGYNYFSMRNATESQASNESIRLVKNLHSFDVLRAERCFSVNGLELRVPFLDQHVIRYSLRISGSLRVSKDEKLLLRNSFRPLFKELGISDTILMRQKERFSDGVGYEWVPTIINHTNNLINKIGSTTQERLQYEKECYKNIYNKLFSVSFILERELPEWAEDSAANSQILGN